MVGDVWTFFVAVFSHWVALVTGGVITALLAVWERRRQRSIPTKVYWVIIAFFVILSFFLAWRDQLSEKRQQEQRANTLQSNVDVLNKTVTELQTARTEQTIVQVVFVELALETVQPFRAGQPIYVNVHYANTGAYRVHNFHDHVKLQFVSDDSNVDSLFQSLYDEIDNFKKTGQEGGIIDPGNPQPTKRSLYIVPTEDEVKAFYGATKVLALAIRIEYNDTLWYERCVSLNPRNLHGKSENWNIRANHNRAGQHPLGRLF